MRAILILFALLSVAASPALEPETLRARAALALAFASPKPNYAASYQKALAETKPLVVFVGQPVREVAGCVCVRVEAFPDAEGTAVVVGIPSAKGLRRVDLPGTPTAEAIRSALSIGRCDGTTNCKP